MLRKMVPPMPPAASCGPDSRAISVSDCVVPEAMAQGCPVIGSAEGGIAETISDNVSGLLVPPGDSVALAAAMRRLSDDPALRTRLRQFAFAEVGRSLNARVQSAALEDLLLRAAHAGRR